MEYENNEISSMMEKLKNMIEKYTEWIIKSESEVEKTHCNVIEIKHIWQMILENRTMPKDQSKHKWIWYCDS